MRVCQFRHFGFEMRQRKPPGAHDRKTFFILKGFWETGKGSGHPVIGSSGHRKRKPFHRRGRRERGEDWKIVESGEAGEEPQGLKPDSIEDIVRHD